MQRDFLAEPDGPLNREARKLVPERHPLGLGVQHARGEALIETLSRLPYQLRQKPQLCVRRHDRHGIEHRPRVVAAARVPSEHGVLHRGGDLLAAGEERLGDEERVA